MQLDGKILALILRGERGGEEEASCHTGTLRTSAGSYEFYRGDDSPSFELEPDWLKRIEPVPDDLKETLLNADYFLLLTVGVIPEDMDVSELIFTGLQIPVED